MALSQGAHIDAIFEELGWFGRYTKLQFFLAFSNAFAAGMHMLSIVFIAKSVEHRCTVPSGSHLDNLTQDTNGTRIGSCFVDTVGMDNSTQRLSSCVHGFDFEGPRERSIISEWDLVCDRAPLSDLLQTLLTAGTAIGAALFPPLADKVGRKPVLTLTTIGMMVTAISIAFSPNYIVFAILRLLLGAFQQGADLTSTVVATEIIVPRKRLLTVVFGSLIWNVAIVLLVPIAYVLREHTWRHLQLAICISSLPVFVYYWLADESLRWLAANGRFKEFERILRKAARMNGKDEGKILAIFRERILPTSRLTLTVSKLEAAADGSAEREAATDTGMTWETSEPTAQVVQYGYLTIFREKRVLVAQLLCCFIWFVNSATYYGLYLTSTEMMDDPYLGFLLNSLVDLPISLVALLLNKVGRRNFTIVCTAAAGVFLLAAVTLSTLAGPVWITSVVFSLIGKFAISTAFCTLFMYTPEIFPTNVRNAAFGLSSVAGRLGGMAAPFSKSLMREVKWAPGVVFGVLCFGATICTWFLPETKDKELPQRPQDMAASRNIWKSRH